ncbi:MAG: hypothetical protein ACLUEQ_05100 [Cloacibacillus evryensis]
MRSPTTCRSFIQFPAGSSCTRGYASLDKTTRVSRPKLVMDVLLGKPVDLLLHHHADQACIADTPWSQAQS